MEAQRPEGPDSGDRAKPKRTRWLVIAAAIAILAVAAQGLWSRRDAHAALEREAEHTSQMSVEVVLPRKSSGGFDLVLPGNVQAFLDTPIYARTTGDRKNGYPEIGAH